MSGPQIALLVVSYPGAGFIIGMMSLVMVLDEATWCPEEGKPALAFTFGVLWPLSLTAGLLYLLWLASRALGRSFAVLWRAWRPRRVEVPKATARERGAQ